MARIIAKSKMAELHKSSVIPLNGDEAVYFLTGSCNQPIVAGKELKKNSFPAYIFRHSEVFVLYVSKKECACLNGKILQLERYVLKHGDELTIGESVMLFLSQ